MHLFEQFQQVGTTVIIASHDWELIERLGKPIVRLHNGTVVDPHVAPITALAEGVDAARG
jgi:cell division transport system ATP-binding protein